MTADDDDDNKNSDNNSKNSEALLSQLSQSTKRSQLSEEFQKRNEAIDEHLKISQDGIFNNIFYERKDATDYLINVFGGEKTLKQYGRGGNSIKLKCSNADCCFRIICKRIQSKKDNPFIVVAEKSKLLHAIIDNNTGKTIGLCNTTKRVTTVYILKL